MIFKKSHKNTKKKEIKFNLMKKSIKIQFKAKKIIIKRFLHAKEKFSQFENVVKSR
jgi:hypothetical protein